MINSKYSKEVNDSLYELFAGNVESAESWMDSYRAALGGRTPERAISDGDELLVVQLMNRLIHGVFS